MVELLSPFDWSGGDPALDFVNTLDERPSDEPEEKLASYGGLISFAELAGLIDASLAARLRTSESDGRAQIIRRACDLREHLFAILSAHQSGRQLPEVSLQAIAREVRQAHAAQSLIAAKTSRLVGYSWRSPDALEIPLYACVLAVERLLVSSDPKRIKKCAAHDCDVYFIDTSKAQRRQWCSMQNCGNREKQRRRRASPQ
jgi:predicted RNA-binding Zn ribbon-like protein